MPSVPNTTTFSFSDIADVLEVETGTRPNDLVEAFSLANIEHFNPWYYYTYKNVFVYDNMLMFRAYNSDTYFASIRPRLGTSRIGPDDWYSGTLLRAADHVWDDCRNGTDAAAFYDPTMIDSDWPNINGIYKVSAKHYDDEGYDYFDICRACLRFEYNPVGKIIDAITLWLPLTSEHDPDYSPPVGETEKWYEFEHLPEGDTPVFPDDFDDPPGIHHFMKNLKAYIATPGSVLGTPDYDEWDPAQSLFTDVKSTTSMIFYYKGLVDLGLGPVPMWGTFLHMIADVAQETRIQTALTTDGKIDMMLVHEDDVNDVEPADDSEYWLKIKAGDFIDVGSGNDFMYVPDTLSPLLVIQYHYP